MSSFISVLKLGHVMLVLRLDNHSTNGGGGLEYYAFTQTRRDSPLIYVDVCVLLGGRQKLLASERSTTVEYQYDTMIILCVFV